MSDSPLQMILQQHDARPVSGEHLEVLGKHAASQWLLGKYASLNEAVVDSVRSEHLSPEQVRRVVEFTNGDAYLQEFRKEGSGHKVVHFDCGPADPSQVLQDLNDGGGGSLYDSGVFDYNMTPSAAKHASASKEGIEGLPKLPNFPALPKNSMQKTAGLMAVLGSAEKNAHYEPHLWDLFNNGQETRMQYAEPLRPLMDMRTKLAAARDQLSSELDALELDYVDACDRLYGQVKQAALDSTSLSDVVQAFASVTSDPVYVKVAFGVFTPRFQRERVFDSLEAIGDSLTKKASCYSVNSEHPLVEAYADFVDVLTKLAESRALQAELVKGASEAEALLLKQSASVGGAIGVTKKVLHAAGRGIDAASKPIAHVLVGGEHASKIAPHFARGTKIVGGAGALLAANAGVQSITDRPAVQGATGAIKSIVPGTAEYQNRRYRNMTGQ